MPRARVPVALLLSLVSATRVQQTQPSTHATTLVNGQLWLDTDARPITAHGGGIILVHGAYYWFGERYGQRGQYPPERGVQAYRSTDLTNWTNLGTVLKVVPDTKSPIQYGSVIERPKALYCEMTRKWVLWFHNELRGQGYRAAHAGVATADKPEGPYILLKSERPDAQVWPLNNTPRANSQTTQPTTRPAQHFDPPPGLAVRPFDLGDPAYGSLVDGFTRGQDARDMSIFLDDDGKAYHLYSSENNATLHVAELTDDYTAHTGRYARIMVNRQREGACLLKHAGKYYLFTSGTTGWKPNPADVAVADTVWGPYRSLGNPWQGTPEQQATSFDSQSTSILKIAQDKYLFMADRWRPGTLEQSPYVWTTVTWESEKPVLRWQDTLELVASSRH